MSLKSPVALQFASWSLVCSFCWLGVVRVFDLIYVNFFGSSPPGKHRMKLISDVFSAVRLNSLSCQAEESNVEFGEQSDTERVTVWHLQRGEDYHPEFKVAADQRSRGWHLERWQMYNSYLKVTDTWTELSWNKWSQSLVWQIRSDSLGYLNGHKYSLFVGRNSPQETNI